MAITIVHSTVAHGHFLLVLVHLRISVSCFCHTRDNFARYKILSLLFFFFIDLFRYCSTVLCIWCFTSSFDVASPHSSYLSGLYYLVDPYILCFKHFGALYSVRSLFTEDV